MTNTNMQDLLVHLYGGVGKLLKLITENPGLRIIPFVASECVPSDDYSYWRSSWGSVKVEEIYEEDGRTYLKSEDFDELVVKHMEMNSLSLPHDECEKVAEEIVEGYSWEKVILVYIEST